MIFNSFELLKIPDWDLYYHDNLLTLCKQRFVFIYGQLQVCFEYVSRSVASIATQSQQFPGRGGEHQEVADIYPGGSFSDKGERGAGSKGVSHTGSVDSCEFYALL